jgi:UDP-glucose 4-epimerase
MLTSYATAHGFAAVSLRYVNVAGAAHGPGERHSTETHLSPSRYRAPPAPARR